ncbi:glycosyltransferase [Paenibacillus planticolens]|uniref:Glycosyltransferase n=1 Tax=Paenibacillus planticolens TaxID=2654976 RepID=A0ABX1ZIV8_9BACL|nr:glycosyltransferase [Paenibacillus planticolens]NOV00012.1 glycosyltransferase [Paenibacillus planticolens]
MNILHVSLGVPPFRTGGLTKYSVDLMLMQLEKQHKVSLLYPGSYHLGGLGISRKRDFQGINVYEIINPLLVPLLGGIKEPESFRKSVNIQVYLKFLSDIRPETIHFHTLQGIHKEFLQAAKKLGIRIIYTTHDYFGICPKVNLMDHLGNICNNYDAGEKCINCNANGYSTLKILAMQSELYRFVKDTSIMRKIRQREKSKNDHIIYEKESAVLTELNETHANKYVDLRNYYLEMFSLIDIFHFNSSTAKSEFEKYLNIQGKVIPITHNDIHDSRVSRQYDNNKPLQIAYLGPVDRYKGFYFLQNSLNELKGGNWHLHIYGDSAKADVDSDSNHYTFHGRYQHADLSSIFKKIDILIVPSIWKETFGFIGLEALSHGVPIMISEHVGLQDIITHGETGIIFKADEKELSEQISAIIENREILSKMNKNILNHDFVFSMQQHTNQMIDFYTTGV